MFRFRSAVYQEGPEAIAAVETSLEASLVCLMIATCPGLDRRLCSDELIESCLGLFKCVGWDGMGWDGMGWDDEH